MSSNKNIYIVLGPLLFIVLHLFGPPASMPNAAYNLILIILWMGLWWITEAIPIAVTSLLPLILFPLTGIVDLSSTAASYGHKIIFLFIGGFILALAILHSSPKSIGSFNSKFHFNSIWKPIKVSTSLLIPLFAFWILNWSLASWSLKIQSQISKNIILHHSLPELKTIDLFALELFPENIRYGSDGWLRLGQYYLLKEDPCMALYWFDKRESRGFAKSKNLEYKARTDCTSIEDN